MKGIIQYLSYCAWLLSLTVMSSPLIVALVRISLLSEAEEYLVVSIYHILFIHSSIGGHLNCFRILAFVNDAAMSKGIQVSLRVSAFSSFIQKK